MEGKFNELELTWIKDVLDQHGEFLTDLLRDEIEAKTLIKTSDLEQSIDYKTTQYGIDPVLQVSFMSYGRAIEVKYHKSKNSSKRQDITSNRLIIGTREATKFKKKDTRWYAKTAYGSLNRLIGILMYEFTNEERTRIKGILEARNTRKS